MRIIRLLFVLLASASAVHAMPATAAEVSEFKVAQQFGIGYLPLTIMKTNGLIEKHLKAAGLRRHQGRLVAIEFSAADERRAALRQPAYRVGRRRAVPDSVGPHARHAQRQGGGGALLDADVSRHQQSEREIDPGLHRQGPHLDGRRRPVDPDHRAADGGGEGIRRRELQQVQHALPQPVASRRSRRVPVGHGDHRLLLVAAVPVPGAAKSPACAAS